MMSSTRIPIPLPPQLRAGGSGPRPSSPDTSRSSPLVRLVADAALLTGGAALRAAADYFKRHAVDASTTTLTIASNDMAFDWVSDWLGTRPEFQKGRRLEVTTEWSKTRKAKDVGAADTVNVKYVPEHGTHLFRYRGVPVMLNRFKESTGSGWSSRQLDKLTFRFMKPDPQIARDMMAEAIAYGLTRDETTVPLYHNEGGYWAFSSFKPKRPASTLFLADGLWDKMVGDIRAYWDGENLYREAAIPYRWSCMLDGPPGTGKTTTAIALASDFGASIYYLNLLSEGLNDDNIGKLMASIPRRSFVLIEDGDALFDSNRAVRTDTLGKKQTALSFTGFLNAMDGLLASEGYVVIVTTNHPDRLDWALTRKGRINETYHIGYATAAQITAYLLRMSRGKVECAKIERFAQRVATLNVPMANIQGALLEARWDVNRAIDEFRLPTAEEEEKLRAAMEGAAPPKKEESTAAPGSPANAQGTAPKTIRPTQRGVANAGK